MMGKIRVIASIRPFITDERPDEAVRVEDGILSLGNTRQSTQRFQYRDFASCYDQSTEADGIKTLFENEIKESLGEVFDGKTLAVICYGATNSGKTHTIQGTAQQPGLIGLTVEELLRRAACTDNQRRIQFQLECIELYGKECRDLLVPKSSVSRPLDIREEESGVFSVPLSKRFQFSSLAEFNTHIGAVNKRRETSATANNRASSRSHALLTIRIFDLPPPQAELHYRPRLLGFVQLVDLAGSERSDPNASVSKRTKDETAEINKSLSTLSRIVTEINSGSSIIPYRETSLTKLLKGALEGSSETLVICNIAPGAERLPQTKSTIEFASKAKNIKKVADPAARQSAYDRVERLRSTDSEVNRVIRDLIDQGVKEQMAILVKDKTPNIVEEPSNAAIVPGSHMGNSTITPNVSAPRQELGPENPFAEDALTSGPADEPPIEPQDQNATEEHESHTPSLAAKAKEEPLDRAKYRRKVNKNLKKTLRENNDSDKALANGRNARACVFAAQLVLTEQNDLEFAVELFERAVSYYPENERLLEETLALKRRYREAQGCDVTRRPVNQKRKPGPLPAANRPNINAKNPTQSHSATLKQIKVESRKAKPAKGKTRSTLAAAVAAFGESHEETGLPATSENAVESSLVLEPNDTLEGQQTTKTRLRRRNGEETYVQGGSGNEEIPSRKRKKVRA